MIDSMEIPNEDKVPVEFVWGDLSFRQGYTQVGYFENDAPNWPRIYVTVPIRWAEAHPELLNDFLIRMTKEFIKYFNTGEINESHGRFEISHLPDKEHAYKILGYFSDEDSKLTFRDSHLLTEEEFVAFKEARDKIAKFYEDTLWYSPIIKNYNDYGKTTRGVLKKFSKNRRPDYSGLDIVNINSSFNNLMASIMSFLNHIEKRLKNRDSKIYWEKFHAHTSDQYDQNVSYRFLYGLRNYIQHQAPPIHIIYKSRLENDKPVYQVNIYCSKKELLESKHWNEKTQEDLIKMGDTIEISSHVASMIESLNQILVKHFQDEFLYLHESAMCVNYLLQKIPQGGGRGVYEIKFSDNKKIRLSAHIMYSDIVEAIVENEPYRILKTS